MPSRLTDFRRESERVRYLMPWAGLLLGVFLVGSAYRDLSIAVPIPPLGRYSLGLAAFYLPAFWRILSMRASRNERAALLVASALFSQLPSLFLCPEYFCTFEELSWWRAVQNLLAGANMIGVGSLDMRSNVYPAMPLLAAVVQNGAGLSTYTTGLILSAIFRVIALLGIFLLGERVFLSTRAGALADLIFLIHPAFFINPGFTANSFGLALVVTALLTAHYAAERGSPDRSAAWSLINLGLILVLAMTQPATGPVLALILAAMTAAERWFRRGTHPPEFRPLGKTAGLTLLISTTWILAASPDTLTAFLARLRDGWLQVQSISLQQQFHPLSTGTLLVPILLLGILSLIGLLFIRRYGHPLTPAARGLLASGVLSLALVAANLDQTSPFTTMALFIGIALLAGLALAWLTAPKRAGEPVWLRISRQILVLTAFAMVLGGLVVPTTPSWRYLNLSPAEGHPAFTRENVDAARWMLTQVGPGNRILGDQTSLRVFGSLGMQDPVSQADPRAWNALSTIHAPLQTLLWLTVSEAPYLILDERQSDPLDLAVRANPAAWMHDPLSTSASAPNPRDVDLDKEPLLARVYDSGQVRIYHLPMAVGPAQSTATSPAANSNPISPEYNQASSIPLAAARIWLSLLFFLFLPGYMLGAILFEDWPALDFLTRLLIAFAGSVCLTLLIAVLTGLLLPAAARTGELVLSVTVLLAALVWRARRQRLPFNAIQIMRPHLLNVHRPYLPALVLAAAGVVVTMLWLIGSAPVVAPRTDFALNLNAPLSLQVVNREGQDVNYTIVAQTDGVGLWQSPPFQVPSGQTIEVDLSGEVLLPIQGNRLELDLLKEGQSSPYRSLYLSTDISSGERLSQQQVTPNGN